MKLLLAEDERALSEVLVTVLKRNGYSVKAVYDGKSALSQLESEIFDGAILDVMMPETDGITVLRTLREDGNNIPVMILTAKSEIEDKVTGFENGANDYLPKPFDTRELLARIGAMMRIQNFQRDETLKAGNIRLKCTTLEISSESSSFRLSGKELQMMRLFMTNPGVPIPAETFLDKVWGSQSRTEAPSVHAYVAFLQKKLSALHADIQIYEIEKEIYQLEAVKS